MTTYSFPSGGSPLSYSLGQASLTGDYGTMSSLLPLAQSQFDYTRSQGLYDYELPQAAANLAQTEWQTARSKGLYGYEAGQAAANLKRTQAELQDYMASAGQREAERQYGEAYAKSKMAFLPQMEAIRGGISQRIMESLNRPSGMAAPSFGGGTQPKTWMQSYSIPKFPS